MDKINLPNNIDINSFIKISSFNGLELMYICSLAYKSRKPFRLVDFKTRIPHLVTEYLFGYLVACNASKILACTYNDDMINVVAYNEELSEKIYAAFNERAKALDDKSNDQEPNFWANQLSIIEQYFE